MTLPTIHLNGTSKESLIDDLCTASDALNAAYEALKQTAPNGRDYYPQGPEAFAKAGGEHLDRLKRLNAIKKEIDDIALALVEIDH